MASQLAVDKRRKTVVVEVSAYSQEAIDAGQGYTMDARDDVVEEAVSEFIDTCHRAAMPMSFTVGLRVDGRVGMAAWSRTEMMLKGVDLVSRDEEEAVRTLRNLANDDAFRAAFFEDDCGRYTATVSPCVGRRSRRGGASARCPSGQPWWWAICSCGSGWPHPKTVCRYPSTV